ncbi:MAG: hypothetical protein LBG43_09575 [Treponema sp.]|nr:hypothetical protein [Treponema sp.]
MPRIRIVSSYHRSVSYAGIERTTKENAFHIRDSVTGMLNQYTELLHATAEGVAFLLHDGASTDAVMRPYLKQTAAILPDISFLYYTSNIRRAEPGGYAAIHLEWIPPSDRDNTARS